MEPLVFPCPLGAERALGFELEALGVVDVTRRDGALMGRGDATVIARANVFSRIAQRVLVVVASGEVESEAALFAALLDVRFERWLGPSDTVAVSAHLERGAFLTHSHYAALKVKDAIVDRFRAKGRERPVVDPRRPTVRFVLHVERARFTLSLDTSGEPLFKRGYRREDGEAPMKETLAAAVLAIGHADVRRPFVDPTCGSGTLGIEQALRVLDRAPGAMRRFAIEGMQHDVWGLRPALKQAHVEARDRARARADVEIRISDWHPKAVAAARANVDAAGLADVVVVEQVDARKADLSAPGVVVCANLPFGERLGGSGALQLDGFYRTLGERLRELDDARILLFTSHPRAEALLDLGRGKTWALPSGKLPSKLHRWDRRPPTQERRPPSGEHDDVG